MTQVWYITRITSSRVNWGSPFTSPVCNRARIAYLVVDLARQSVRQTDLVRQSACQTWSSIQTLSVTQSLFLFFLDLISLSLFGCDRIFRLRAWEMLNGMFFCGNMDFHINQHQYAGQKNAKKLLSWQFFKWAGSNSEHLSMSE